MKKNNNIKIYYGPMYSGKTTRIIKDIKNNDNENKLIFKPVADKRSNKIISRNNTETNAININKSNEILDYIKFNTKNIYIDEIHFFDKKIVGVVKTLSGRGIKITLSGLDTDYMKNDFPHVREIINLTKFKNRKRLSAKCYECNKKAIFSARFLGNKPVDKKGKINISDNEIKNLSYKPTCKKHHPTFKKINN